MDSLLASYASSDEEEEEQQRHPEDISIKPVFKSGGTSSISRETTQTSRIFSSLPQPRSSSSAFPSPPQPKSSPAFPLLPQPKSSSFAFPSPPQPKSSSSDFSSLPPPNSSSIFSSLPPPTSDNPQTPLIPPSSDSKPKRVVQFRPPIMLKPPNDEDDDEEEEKQRKPIKETTTSSSTSSLSSFFSSLPAPKNTLGSGSAPALGAGRRSIVETNVSESNYDGTKLEIKGVSINESQENYSGNWGDGSSSVSTSEPLTTGSDPSNWIPSNDNYGSYGYYGDNGNYGDYKGNYGKYDGVSTIASTTLAPETLGLIESVAKMPGKRGRNEIPADMVEVKQDELMKNRPREDQVKMTGIAFGPSYQQPASTKGKPSKLHKRKHQIGSLYFDMRQKESELAERRSKGFLTKAETQAKYGW